MDITARPSIDPAHITIEKLFPTPFACVRHPLGADLDERLRTTILEHEARETGVRHSNEGGWQSRDDFLDWSGQAGRDLVDFAKTFADTLSAVDHPERGLVETSLDWTFNAWANVNRAGQGNAPHAHFGSYWSAVYWVDDGREDDGTAVGGDLEFMDPRGAMPSMLSPYLRMKIDGCLSAGVAHVIRPVSGMLVMFPSWLMHAVTAYRGQRPRISVAINLAP